MCAASGSRMSDGRGGALAALREWMEAERLVRCDVSVPDMTVVVHGRFIGVEPELISVCSSDTRAELVLDLQRVERWGTFTKSFPDGTLRAGIVAYLPEDNTVTFSVVEE